MNPLKGKNFKKILTRASKGLKGLNPKFKNFGKRHINSEGKWQVTALLGQKFRPFCRILKRKVTNGPMTT